MTHVIHFSVLINPFPIPEHFICNISAILPGPGVKVTIHFVPSVKSSVH